MVLAEKDRKLSPNEIIGLIVLIAKHHGNLPDFCPYGTDGYILSKNEIKDLFSFLRNYDLPFYNYVKYFYSQTHDFSSIVTNEKAQNVFLEKLAFSPKINNEPLNYYLKIQSAFANLILADKADAAKFDSYVKEDKDDVETFSVVFCKKLDSFLKSLNQNSGI